MKRRKQLSTCRHCEMDPTCGEFVQPTHDPTNVWRCDRIWGHEGDHFGFDHDGMQHRWKPGVA